MRVLKGEERGGGRKVEKTKICCLGTNCKSNKIKKGKEALIMKEGT